MIKPSYVVLKPLKVVQEESGKHWKNWLDKMKDDASRIQWAIMMGDQM